MMGIEIIPNWHPIFVHFTIALFSIASLFYLAGLVLKKPNLLIVARWNLWAGAIFTVGTLLAGFYAYNTVPHDGPSHVAMTDHKNWAIATSLFFGVLALWSVCKHRGTKTVSFVFVALILIASALLAVTGFKGGEVVYRHGIGVMRMPEVSASGGDGHEGHAHGAEDASSVKKTTDDHSSHAH